MQLASCSGHCSCAPREVGVMIVTGSRERATYSWGHTILGRVLTLPLPWLCVALGTLMKLSEAPFSSCKTEVALLHLNSVIRVKLGYMCQNVQHILRLITLNL